MSISSGLVSSLVDKTTVQQTKVQQFETNSRQGLGFEKKNLRVIASYLKQVWDKNDWLYKGQHGFRPGYSYESQVIMVCQDIADSLDNGDKIDAIIVDFSKAFDLVPHGQLLTKIANSGMDSRVVVWIREFLLGHIQRVRVGGQLSEEVRVMSGVPQGSVLGPLLFLA